MFKQFNAAIQKQFQKMTATKLFTVAVDKDKLWEAYLNSFPDGSNPIYKKRTEHDCGCCRQFVRSVGNVVTIADNEVVSIWDTEVDSPYKEVADAMAALVKSAEIDGAFLHYEKTAGTSTSRMLLEDKSVKTWDHFFITLPDYIVVKKDALAAKLGEIRTTFEVMKRGLDTITRDALDVVLDLIGQNSLYRGEENLFAVESFAGLKQKYDSLPEEKRGIFAWSLVGTTGTGNGASAIPESVARIRNTAIGTLLVDLSEGSEIEDAVKSFEAKVAPTNYKRPTALVTKAMIAQAQKTVAEIGLLPSLERRYATLEDITINNILFADRSARKEMNAFESLASETPERSRKAAASVNEISIDDFLASVVPNAESLEVLVENRHAGNFVSLIAPADPTAKLLFKWGNGFSWSYAGELTDSIKERVKRAGGSITGDLCCRLAWNYTDDLDFHMFEPSRGVAFDHIYYPNRRQKSANGGMLDLDANGADGAREDPAENIFYEDRRTMKDGLYRLAVHNYDRRSAGKGFEVEIEFDGTVYSMACDKVLATGDMIQVAVIKCEKGKFEIVESLPASQTSKIVWSVPTQTYRKVNVVMLSPNHWNGHPVGNRHYFFMLDGCSNAGKSRGFFNEFLREDLAPHRKVLEMVGAKMRTEEAARQLSGLGFSSTRRDSVLCRVNGSFTRTLKINF